MSVVRGRLGGAAGVVAVMAAYALGAALLTGHAGHVWADAWWTAAGLASALLAARTAQRMVAGPRRRAWWWFTAGSAAWFVGMLVWSYDELVAGALTPFPSIADALFLALAPCFVIGVFAYLGAHRSVALTLKQVGDLAIIVCVMVPVAVLALDRPVGASSDDRLYVLTALAYPALHGSALVFGLIGWWQYVGARRRWVLGLQLAGMSLLCVTATLYAESLLGRRYQAGAWIDPLWIGTFALLGWAAREELQLDPHDADQPRREAAPAADAVVPAVAVLIAVIGGLAFRDRWGPVAIATSGVCGIGLALGLALRLASSQALERRLRAQLRTDDERARRLQVQLMHAQRLQAIGTLAGGVAHDYKNLLQVMIAGLTLVRRQLERGLPATAELDEVERALWRAADLSARLLDLARKRPAEVGVVDASRVVEAVAGLLRKVLPEGVGLEVSPASGPAAIAVDPVGLEHALLDLGINARDAMGGRTGRVRLAVRRGAVAGIAGSAVVITIDDDGPGIPADVLPRVFEPFFTTKAAGEGTGLGLATVEAFAAEHGGTVRAANRPGGGARFELAFPAAAPVAPGREAPAVGGGATVLVVDSGEASRLAVTGALERSGYQPILVASREAALLAAARDGRHIAAVVSDASSGLVGTEALAALRATGCGAPVVLLTAADASPSGDYAAIVQKPLDPHRLVDAVASAIGPG